MFVLHLIRFHHFTTGDTMANNDISSVDDDDDDDSNDCSHSCVSYLHFLSGGALSPPTPFTTALSQHITCPVITDTSSLMLVKRAFSQLWECM